MKSWPHSRSFMFCMCYVLHTFPPSTTTSSWNLFITIFREEKSMWITHVYSHMNTNTHTHKSRSVKIRGKDESFAKASNTSMQSKKHALSLSSSFVTEHEIFALLYCFQCVRKKHTQQQNTKLILTVREKRVHCVSHPK